MAEQICLREYRKMVDEQYVGFKPNGGSIKPVHVADGVLRSIAGSIADTTKIKRLSYVISAQGNTPSGNELESVKQMLMDYDCLDEEIEDIDLESMRNILQKILGADNGVFYAKKGPVKDGMVSFTAGSRYFITRRAEYEDTGEFIGGFIREYCPELSGYIKEGLDAAEDPISILFSPVLEKDPIQTVDKLLHEDLPTLQQKNSAMEWFIKGMHDGGLCLLDNFKNHPNFLTQLRLFSFFCIFHLLRYLAMLEAFYCEGWIRPILLDFTGNAQSSIARASMMSYTQMHRAISRFYAWGYAQKLRDMTKDELLSSETPVYEVTNNVSKTGKKELDRMWDMAKEEASDCSNDEEMRIIFGTTMYDMLALEASSHPINCLKALGTQSGILYPPDKMHPNKRFVLSQDVLEMVLRSCVQSDETISSKELRYRLWDRFGIIIGGSSLELEKLQANGMILQVDNDSLENNFASFASLLETMDFAEIMADGILQIRLGGTN